MGRERALTRLRALGNGDRWKEPRPCWLTCAEHALHGFRGQVLGAEQHQELSENANSHPTCPGHLESKSAGDSYTR